MKPEYLCNTTVSNWQKEPDKETFEALTLSPTGIERLEENPDEYSGFAGKVTFKIELIYPKNAVRL